MPEQERQIEKLLKAYADKRRGQAGDGFPLHPATRNMLLSEVKRKYASKGHSPSLFSVLLQKYWRPIGFAFSVLVVLGMVLVALNPPAKRQEMAMKGEGATDRETLHDWTVTPSPENQPAAPHSTAAPAGPAATPEMGRSPEAPVRGLESLKLLQDTSGAGAKASKAEADARGRRLEDEVRLSDKPAPSDMRLSLAAPSVTDPPPPPMKPGSAPGPSGSTIAAATAQLGMPLRGASGSGGGVGGAEPQTKRDLGETPEVLREKTQVAYDALAVQAEQKVLSEKLAEASTVPTNMLYFRNNAYMDGITLGGQVTSFAKEQAAPGAASPESRRARFQNSETGFGVQPPAEPQIAAKSKTDQPALAAQAPSQPAILNSFFVEQNGDQVRIIDEDGSVYDGKLGNADVKNFRRFYSVQTTPERNLTRKVEAGKDTAAQEALAQQVQYPFVAAGTNRLYQQRVVINGVLAGPLDTNFSQSEAELLKRTTMEPATRHRAAENDLLQQKRARTPAQNSLLQLQNISQIQGTARIGASNELKVNATRTNP